MLLPMSLSFTSYSAHSPLAAHHTREPSLLSSSPCSPNNWATCTNCCSWQKVNVLRMAGRLPLVSSQTPQTMLTLLSACSPQTTLACNSCFQQSKYFRYHFSLPQESSKLHQQKEARRWCSYNTHQCDVLAVSVMLSPGAEWFYYSSY